MNAIFLQSENEWTSSAEITKLDEVLLLLAEQT